MNTRCSKTVRFLSVTVSAARLLPLVLLTLLTTAEAQFICTTNNGAITITGYTGPGGEVSIPSVIEGLPVTSIGDQAFASRPLTSISIPDSVTNIGFNAFRQCTSLNNASIGSGVSSIGEAPFRYCYSLKSISVDALNGFYSSVDGVLFNKTHTLLVAFPVGKPEAYAIPSSVACIAKWAFVGWQNVTNLTIPDSVITIEDSSFAGCTNLTSLTTGNGVTSIGYAAFTGAKNLSDLTFGGAITNIGSSAFQDCFSLTDVTIPDNVITIGISAFAACRSLTSVALGNGLASIGAGAFQQTSLSSVTVPGSVTDIKGAFQSCQYLTNVVILDGLPSIGQEAFLNCTRLASISIPSSVTNIGNRAFQQCFALGSIAVGDGVIRIGTNAFAVCRSLTNVVMGRSVEYIADRAFQDCTQLKAIYFTGNAPAVGFAAVGSAYNATVYYLPGTTGWSSTFDHLPALLWNPQFPCSSSDFGVGTDGFGLNVTGTANIPLVVEASSDFVAWVPVQSCTLTNGSVSFSDPTWTNSPSRFYRIRSP